MGQVLRTHPVRHGEALWLTAPALVLVAACATAQADAALPATTHVARPGIAAASWAAGSPACAWNETRVALARQAAFVIHALDRLACAHAAPLYETVARLPGQPSPTLPDAVAMLSARLDPGHTSPPSAAP